LPLNATQRIKEKAYFSTDDGRNRVDETFYWHQPVFLVKVAAHLPSSTQGFVLTAHEVPEVAALKLMIIG